MLSYESLKALADRLSNAPGGDEDLDLDVFSAFHDAFSPEVRMALPTRSVDDAHMLLQALDPARAVAVNLFLQRGECRVALHDGLYVGIARGSADRIPLILTEAVVRWAAARQRGLNVDIEYKG